MITASTPASPGHCCCHILLVSALGGLLWGVSLETGATLPDLGQDAATIISPHEERRIGEDIMGRIRQSLAFVNDPELEDYLARLGNRLSASLTDRHPRFHFFLIDHPSINAFALPGGFIGIHTGLVIKSQSEDELAAVLAHEITHVTQRHWPRLVAAQKKQAGITLAAILASLVIASSGQPGGEAVAIIATVAGQDAQLVFTRAFEREADRLGMNILDKARFDVRAMAVFFERLAEHNRINASNLPEFMRTHPVTHARLAEARNNIGRFTPHVHQDSIDYQHFRARTTARYMTDRRQALSIFQQKSSGKSPSPYSQRAAQYGHTLALQRSGDLKSAYRQIRSLRKRFPKELRYRLTEADIDFAAGRRRQALAAYAQIYRQRPNSSWVIRRYVDTLLDAHRPTTAVKILKSALRQHPEEAMFNKLMATAAGETGDRIQAHRSLAEYYFLSGDMPSALHQLGIAARHAKNDYYARSAISARIAEIRSHLKHTKP